MMKRTIGLVLAVLLVLLAVAAAAEDGGGKTMWVCTQNGKVLLVRTSMSTKDDSNVAGTLPYRAKVVCYGQMNGWAVIEYCGQHDHYVQYRFLVDHDPGPYNPGSTPSSSTSASSAKEATTVAQMNALVESAKFVAPYYVTVRPVRASGWVYMRWFPSKNAAQIATFNANYQLIVIAELGDWYQVEDPETGKVGFVYKSYVQ